LVSIGMPTSTRNKHVVNHKLEYCDNVSFREQFVRIGNNNYPLLKQDISSFL